MNSNHDLTLQEIIKRLKAAKCITDFDRCVYVNAYGSEAVGFIEATCEQMPDIENPNNRIGAMLNIAYDKGFDDCYQMILNVIMERGVSVE
jgi:hypothetical protein